MSASRQLNRRLPDRLEPAAMIIGAIVSWVLVALIFRFATTKIFIFSCVLSGPCVLLLTYFAFGGDIPLKLRQKGYRRVVMVGIAFWISLVAAFVVAHFLPLGTE
jgi:hypothetical protein